MRTKLLFACLLAVGVVWPGFAFASCGASFCALNTQWETQGVLTEPGLRADLRFEYIKQDQLRNGRDALQVGQIRRHHDEVSTINRNWIAAVDYATAGPWGMGLQIPYTVRSHQHIHNHHGAQIAEAWDFAAFGDVRALARYRFGAEGTTGVLMGVKLPTGNTDVRNAAGSPAERPLQPGTGTTDGIAGWFRNHAWLLNDLPASTFVLAQFQFALNEYHDYRPGNQFIIDAGVTLPATENLTALLQTNLLVKTRDRGLEAEPEDTGGASLWLSPGLSYAVHPRMSVYGFVQLPVYQYVNGVQLTADWAATAGANWRF